MTSSGGCSGAPISCPTRSLQPRTPPFPGSSLPWPGALVVVPALDGVLAWATEHWMVRLELVRRPETRWEAGKALRLGTWEDGMGVRGRHGKAAIGGRAACGRNVDFRALNIAFIFSLWPPCPTVGSRWQGIEVSRVAAWCWRLCVPYLVSPPHPARRLALFS